jgi:hypothetical protein
MAHWEYLIVDCELAAEPADLVETFSGHGAQGWELAATRPVILVSASSRWLAIFKRPVSIVGERD